MPGPLDALLDTSELSQLYMYLLKQKVKEQYKGHQDYHLILNAIDSNFPMYGGKVTVQKQDKHGNIYTITYNVKVFDDLGNPIEGADDIGGRCLNGEIAKKGSIFRCKKCGNLVCTRHVEFVDDDMEKPLCRYGFLDMAGCYFLYSRKYSTKDERELEDKKEIERYKRELEKKKLQAELIQADNEIKAAKENPLISAPGKTLLPGKKTGSFGRLLHGSVFSFTCGNCKRRIFLDNIVCSNCRNVINIDIDSALVCPVCRNPINEVQCSNCEAINTL